MVAIESNANTYLETLGSVGGNNLLTRAKYTPRGKYLPGCIQNYDWEKGSADESKTYTLALGSMFC